MFLFVMRLFLHTDFRVILIIAVIYLMEVKGKKFIALSYRVSLRCILRHVN